MYRGVLPCLWKILLCWREGVRNGRWLNFWDKTELQEGNPRYYDNLERLRGNDITSIVLCYEDGAEKKIAVPFKPTNADAVESSLQSTTLDGKGRWEVEILPDGNENFETSLPWLAGESKEKKEQPDDLRDNTE